ncbi:MAG TPA: tetratricopeptide repeat protein [Elusimicrobiota bacterium]|nr:tetratricopeptide repeat protein [Elusimicrobiota bacterium]
MAVMRTSYIRSKLLVLGAPAAMLMLAPGRARAQDAQTEGQRPSLEQRRADESVAASNESSQGGLSGETVTYEQVLAAPDNPDLNYRYALAQARRGDLKGASATLERMLLVSPNQARIRLFYAAVLYRLDNDEEALRQLDRLKAMPRLPKDVLAEASHYRSLVASRLKKNHLAGRIGGGIQYDTNRNAAPSSGERLFLDIPIPLSLASQRRDDASIVAIGGLDYRRELEDGPSLFASGSYYQAEQTLVKALNLKAYSASAGAVWQRGRDTLTPALVFDHIQLAQQTYLRDRGFDLRYEHKIDRNGDVYAQVHDVFQDYLPTDVVPIASDRTGIQLDATVGGDYVVAPTNRVGLGFQHAWKHASNHIYGFERNALLLNDIWLLGKGTFLLSSLGLQFDDYRQVDEALTAQARHDEILRVAATYGVPLSLVHPALKDLLLTFTYEYYQAMSSVENYAYTNNKLGTLLLYKFDIGF